MQTDNQQKDNGLHKHIGISDILAHWFVLLFAIPIGFVGSVLGQFLKRAGAGGEILGAMALAIGTIMSADGIWQTFFQGVPIFPWYESDWIGWRGWLTLPFNILFWISVLISYLVIRVEAKSLRGTAPDQAKSEYQQSLQYELPKKPDGVIDMTRALWARYKKSGLSKYRNSGLVALGFWAFDLVATFTSRWPWRYTQPGDIVVCFAVNCGMMLAGEIAYTIWEDMKEERRLASGAGSGNKFGSSKRN
jgi:hypothetical protein